MRSRIRRSKRRRLPLPTSLLVFGTTWMALAGTHWILSTTRGEDVTVAVAFLQGGAVVTILGLVLWLLRRGLPARDNTLKGRW